MRFANITTLGFSGLAALALAGCSGADAEKADGDASAADGAAAGSADESGGHSELYVEGPKRAGDLEINAINLAYLYHRMSGEPASLDRMMTKPLNLTFENEFERRRFLEEHFDEFKKLVDESVSAQTYTVELRGRLEDYDFDRKGFPIDGLYDRTMVSFSASDSGSEGLDFALALEGTEQLDFLPMSPEAAEALGSGDRSVDLEIAFTPIMAGWEKVRSDQRRTVVGKAYQVTVKSSEGKTIGTIRSDQKPSTRPLRLYAQNPMVRANLANPWTAENAPEAVLDRYAWIIDERWKMPGHKDGDAFEEAMSNNGSAAGGCVAQFGFSQCERLATRRANFVNQCTNSVPTERKQECYAIRSLPYTELEANAL